MLSVQEPYDPRQRIADLERQLAEARLDSVSPQWQSSPAEPDSRLSSAPRRIPVRFLIAEVLPFRWWYLFAIFMVTVPAVIVWALEPKAAAPAAIATLALIYAWQLRGTRKRLALLRWGQVATVVQSEIVDQATYFGGVTWYNAPLPIARGWAVDRSLWSGPSTKTRITYVLNGYQGELRVSGREYLDGVVLADQRHPERALCVTSFPYDLDRDAKGDWTGRLRPRLALGMFVWFVVVVCWLTAAVAITTGLATRLLQQAQILTAGPGVVVHVEGTDLARTVRCEGGDLEVDGNENVVTATGHCGSVTVGGNKNTVSIDTADSIHVSAIRGHVTYHTGSPKITDFGIDNTISRG